MKHLIILLLFGIGSCHVHYHIEPKTEQKEQTRSGIILTNSHCGVIGCAVYHGNNYLGSDWGNFMGKYPKDSINPNVRLVHAASELSQ